MFGFISLNKSNYSRQKISFCLEVIVYALCFITAILAAIANNLSLDLYNTTVALGFFSLILRRHTLKYAPHYWLLPLSIIIIGVIDAIWYSMFKESSSPYLNTYHNYLNTARVFILGSVLALLACTSNIKINKALPIYIMYSLSFAIVIYAFYRKFIVGMGRLDFGIGTATGASYSILLLGTISAISILYTKKSHPFLFILNSLAIFITVILTETRAAILIMPVISALVLIIYCNYSSGKLLKSMLGLIIVLAAMISIFNKPIIDRYHSAVSDLTKYQNKNNSNNSLGARLAMYQVGIAVFKEAPFTLRSAEMRDQQMKKQVERDSRLQGALKFSNVHLHNEIIEAASLKGIAGIGSTLLFYIALLYTAFKRKSLGLFVLTLVIMGCGLSDVIIWARSIPIIIVTAIPLVLLMAKNSEDSNTQIGISPQ